MARKKLSSLEEHNAMIEELEKEWLEREAEKCLNGIACPKCANELFDFGGRPPKAAKESSADEDALLQIPIECRNCGWSGKRFELPDRMKPSA